MHKAHGAWSMAQTQQDTEAAYNKARCQLAHENPGVSR